MKKSIFYIRVLLPRTGVQTELLRTKFCYTSFKQLENKRIKEKMSNEPHIGKTNNELSEW